MLQKCMRMFSLWNKHVIMLKEQETEERINTLRGMVLEQSKSVESGIVAIVRERLIDVARKTSVQSFEGISSTKNIADPDEHFLDLKKGLRADIQEQNMKIKESRMDNTDDIHKMQGFTLLKACRIITTPYVERVASCHAMHIMSGLDFTCHARPCHNMPYQNLDTKYHQRSVTTALVP